MTDYYWTLRTETGRKYDPGQPREPAGNPHGGRWTAADGSSYALIQEDLFSGEPSLSVDAKDKAMLDFVVDQVTKLTGVDESDLVLSLQEVIMGPCLGAQTTFKGGPRKGQWVTAISPRRIRMALERHSPATLAEWHGIYGDVNYESLFKHVVAHELGHWLEDNTTGLIGKFTAEADREHRSDLSGYSRKYGDSLEGFCDAFAGYVLGYEMPAGLEDWFHENVGPGTSREASIERSRDWLREVQGT